VPAKGALETGEYARAPLSKHRGVGLLSVGQIAAELTSGHFLVGQFRTPRLPAAFWREIEEVPERPDHINVARILARLFGRKHEFGLIEMVDRAVSALEYIQCWYLFPFGRFAVVVVVVAIQGGREQTVIASAAFLRERTNAFERRFSDDYKIHAVQDMWRGAVEPIQNGRARRAG